MHYRRDCKKNLKSLFGNSIDENYIWKNLTYFFFINIFAPSKSSVHVFQVLKYSDN